MVDMLSVCPDPPPVATQTNDYKVSIFFISYVGGERAETERDGGVGLGWGGADSRRRSGGRPGA